MSTKKVGKNEEANSTSVADLALKLAAVVIPVSDLDRANSSTHGSRRRSALRERELKIKTQLVSKHRHFSVYNGHSP